MSLEPDLKTIIIEEDIVKIKPEEEEFTLKSGKKSRFFFDVKEASLNPDILTRIVEEIELKKGHYIEQNFDSIASVAVGGVPLGTALSLKLFMPQIIVRSEKHESGIKLKIIGKCKNKTILIIEDVATTGGSIVKAVKDIREAGGICNTCIVVIDREEGAEKLCEYNGIKLYSLLKKSDFGNIL
ncbi:orotate phosphoribosyltransferase [Patescibacteria group bacterium]|nr:orotate phosphoribosyltransferase [Patescibacteria group bacterium]